MNHCSENLKHRRLGRLLVTASLCASLSLLAPLGSATPTEPANRLTEQEKRELEQMVAKSKQQRVEIPALQQQKKLSQSEQQAMQQLVDQSQQAITPMLKQEVQSLLNSQQYRENLEAAKPLARKALGLPVDLGEKAAPTVPTEGQVLVFVSRSVPLSTLRNYVKALVKVKGAMVLRGGINGLGKIGPTLAFSEQVLKIDPHCTHHCSLHNVPLFIDPLLFRRHHITAVPAITFQPEGVISGCDAETNAPAGNVIYGDVSLLGALEKLQQMAPHTTLVNLSKQLEN